MNDLPEAGVQELLRKMKEEPVVCTLQLTEDQKSWLYRAMYIFQAHERQMTWSASAGDRIFTEAIIRHILEKFDE